MYFLSNISRFHHFRYVYAVPFLPSEQKLSPEERGEVFSCGREWTRTLSAAVRSVREDAFKEDPEDPAGAIPGEFAWWAARADRLRGIRKELATPSVQR